MLIFQLNLSQRDSVVTLFNRLNELIFSDGQPLEEIDECVRETNRLIIMLNDLKLANEESESSSAGESIERPAKKSRTEASQRDQIMFDIHLDVVLDIIKQILKNQKAITYANLLVQADKIRLLRENTGMIGKLQDLPLTSTGNQPSGGRYRVIRVPISGRLVESFDSKV